MYNQNDRLVSAVGDRFLLSFINPMINVINYFSVNAILYEITVMCILVY